MDGPILHSTEDAPEREDMPKEMPHREEPEKQTGSLVGTIVIILVLAVGGLYFWGARLNREAETDTDLNPSGATPEEIATMPDPALESLGAQGTSDTVEDIGTDLGATDLQSVDADLGNIEREF